jgi:putative mRNA 3-end processing factor
MNVTRVCCLCLREGRDGAGAVTEPFTQLTEQKPGGGIVRRELERLYQQVGGPRQIALCLSVACPLKAPVGNYIAGGQEYWACHFLVLCRLAPNTYLNTMRAEDILVPTPSGVCCKPGGFHIDPTRPVEKALITHGHSDHARAGHGAVLATQETLDIMRLRYGDKFAGSTQAVRYGELVKLDGANVSFHPAGHVLGSAQIHVECNGLRVVASGDYKDVTDPTCTQFELVPCDVFITEATFGLPVFRHHDAAGEIGKLLRSVELFPERSHLVGAYTLGKAQRVIAMLRAAGHDQPVYIHGAMETITRYYESRAINLGRVELVRGANKAELGGHIVICPPSAMSDLWSRRFPDPVAAFASGWMRVRARARQRGVTLPLVISDHADWNGLTTTIAATGASEVWVTHGQEDALVHWCRARGLKARPLDIVGYGDEEDAGAQAEAEA